MVIFNEVISLLTFWIGDMVFTDNLLLQQLVEILDVLIKSANICRAL